MEDEAFAVDEDWDLLQSFFPKGWEDLAMQSDALKGLRKDKSAKLLLRTLLLHVGCGHSLRETVVRAREAKLADLSDVALLKRLRKSVDWLHAMCQALWGERLACDHEQTRAMHLIDGSIICEPGKTGSRWRLHYSLRWPSLSCDFFKLTPVEGEGSGENLTQFPVRPGEFYLADRGYSSPSGIRHITQHGGHLCVRLNPSAVRICEPKGELFPLIDELQKIQKPNQVGQWRVTIADSAGKVAAKGRLCALRKSLAATQMAQAKLKIKAKKRGETLRPETLEYAKYVMVFTTFPAKQFPASSVLRWYRLRWQVELVFKRFKQIAELGHLPKYDPESAKGWLYGKLFVALLTEKLLAHAQSFSPWGYGLDQRSNSQ